MKPLSRRWLIPSLLLMALALLPAASGPQPDIFAAVTEQSRTLLSDGRWLLLGGRDRQGIRWDAWLWDSRTQTATPVAQQLHYARAAHSATVLPDGTVLILGGIGGDGHLVGAVELFRAETGAFELLTGTGLPSRAGHTATLLADGRVLIAGGVGDAGQPMPGADLWDPQSQRIVGSAALSTPRSRHTATLLADRTVLLWGGLDQSGHTLNTGEFFDPLAGSFTGLTTLPPEAYSASGTLHLAESLPPDGATDVPTDVQIVLHFSHGLRPEILTNGALALSGPTGSHDVTTVVAEGGRLAFVTPAPPCWPARRTRCLSSGQGTTPAFSSRRRASSSPRTPLRARARQLHCCRARRPHHRPHLGRRSARRLRRAQRGTTRPGRPALRRRGARVDRTRPGKPCHPSKRPPALRRSLAKCSGSTASHCPTSPCGSTSPPFGPTALAASS